MTDHPPTKNNLDYSNKAMLYEWVEPFGYDEETQSLIGTSTHQLTGEEILTYYYDTWFLQMLRKYKEPNHLFTEENCIKDFVNIHFAYVVN